MTALEVILVSRKASVAKVTEQVAALDEALKSCSVSVKPVYEAERKVKAQRLARLLADVAALESEIERQNPTLPGLGAKPPVVHKK